MFQTPLKYDTNLFIECGLVSLALGFLGAEGEESSSELLLLHSESGVEKCHKPVVM